MSGYGKAENGFFNVFLADVTFEGVIYFGETKTTKRKKYSNAYVSHLKTDPAGVYLFYLPKGQKYKGEELVKISID